MKKLELTNCRLDSIPPFLAYFQDLEELVFSQSDITEIPPWIFDLPNIKNINFSDCPLSESAMLFLNNQHGRVNANGEEIDILFDTSAQTNTWSIEDGLDIIYKNEEEKKSDIQDKLQALAQNTDGDKKQVYEILKNVLQRRDLFRRKIIVIEIKKILEGLNDVNQEVFFTNTQILSASLGNCNTPIVEMLTKKHLSEITSKLIENTSEYFGKLPEEEKAFLTKAALEQRILQEIPRALFNNRESDLAPVEHIEKINAILDAFFVPNAENHSDNSTLRIKGDRPRVASTSDYLFFGLQLLKGNHKLLENVAKIACKTDDKGNLLIQQDNHGAACYELDNAKLSEILDSWLYEHQIYTTQRKVAIKFEGEIIKLIDDSRRKLNEKNIDITSEEVDQATSFLLIDQP